MLGGVPQSTVCTVPWGITCQRIATVPWDPEMEASWLSKPGNEETSQTVPPNWGNRHKNQGTKYILSVSSLQETVKHFKVYS